MLNYIFPSRLKIINTPTIDAKQKDGALQMLFFLFLLCFYYAASLDAFLNRIQGAMLL
jgi:hypothetical protein